MWFLLLACQVNDEIVRQDTAVIGDDVAKISKKIDESLAPPALNKDGLPNLIPLDTAFEGLTNGCTVSEALQKWLDSLASYRAEPPGWRPITVQQGKWRRYFSPPKATVYNDYTKLEMKGAQVSYLRFGVSKVEYILGHQNGISALSIWLTAPKEIVAPNIKLESVEDPILGTIEMTINDAEGETKLVCDWSN